jgi:hypothetical protein
MIVCRRRGWPGQRTTFGADLRNSLRPKPRDELALESASLLTLRVEKVNDL